MGQSVTKEKLRILILEDTAADAEQKKQLAKLSPQQVTLTELAGEKIQSILTHSPGNNAAIGGLKVITENGWFAARPSGTEDIYKIYAESFNGQDHLSRILKEAQTIVDATLAPSKQQTEIASAKNSKKKS